MTTDERGDFGPPRWFLVLLAVATVVVVVSAITVALRFNDAANVAGDNKRILEGQSTSIKKINELLDGLQVAEEQRQTTAKQQGIAFAVVLEGIAGGFATPPAPDPDRLAAVQKLCDTAAAFRASAGDMNPPACPAP